jgi:hypothetical protein
MLGAKVSEVQDRLRAPVAPKDRVPTLDISRAAK